MANYQSQYTGAQIDEAIGKATEVVANPTETGSTDLTSLKVGETVYNVPSGGGGYTVLAKDPITINNVIYADGHEDSTKSLDQNETLNNVVYFEYTATSTAMGVKGAIIAKTYANTSIYFSVDSIKAYIATPEWNKAYIIPVGNCTLEYSSN